ncbi:MAG: DUF3237 family protein [Clostridiales bacterium]|nr:DUF3237 family protein [Clostridiales bacterium]
MELLLEIEVHLTGAMNVKGKKQEVVMLPFTGKAGGPYFQGQVMGTGCDTQKITPDSFALSARYMLEGKDCEGKPCRIFVENNGHSLEQLTPMLVTDSQALAHWEEIPLKSVVTPTEECVWVRIYAE